MHSLRAWMSFATLAFLIGACGSEPPSSEEKLTYAVQLDEDFQTEPFTEVSGIARLDDGTVIVADVAEGGLVPIGPDGERGDPFGSEGQGPGEFMRITEVAPLEGDTFAVVDGQQRRVIFYTADGDLVEQLGYPEEVRMSPRGVSAGGLVARSPVTGENDGDEFRLPLLGWAWEDDRVDTLTMVRHRPLHLVGGGTGSTPYEVWEPEWYAPEDVWGVTTHGDVVVVTAEPYTVETYSGGERTLGPVLDYTPVPVTVEDRERAEGQLRGTAPWSWREAKPPFRPERIWVNAQAEEIWVRTWEEQEGSYDLLSFSGERIGRVLIVTDMEPVLLSGSEIYLIEEDELGFQWLRRGELRQLEPTESA